MHSDEISAELGGDILNKYQDVKVDVHNPDYLLKIEIFFKDKYYNFNTNSNYFLKHNWC